MPLQPGTLLGPYEILELLGKGGMGEVYRAHDPRVHRDVAIKIAAAQFSERFEREAKAVAALNHPNICTLFDVGPNYLVMELVQGPTLKERIASGPIPLEEALGIATQLTHALESAHEKPVVHRDLKPANIKIRPDGTVKVLDFGLAKTVVPHTSRGDPANSPTLTMSMTEAGVILGTAGYMSPEQARGEPVDQRADIWAFGVVLYEMLTARRMFEGRTVSDTLAAVLIQEPDLGQVPASVRPLLRRCLSKDPKTRLHHAADARLMLREEHPPEVQAPAGQAVSPPASRWIYAGAAVATLALAALAWVHFREQPPVKELVRFAVPAPDKALFILSPPAVSPDGRKLAFIASQDGRAPQLWVRSLDTLEARPLSGTENPFAALFSWSPDSRSIVYAQGGRLRRVEVAGGPPQTVCDLSSAGGFRGSAWGSSGVIAFGAAGSGLWRVAEAGGAPSPLTKLDPSRGETYHGNPWFLPGGRHFLYLRASSAAESRGIYIGALDVKPEQQSTKRLIAAASTAVYAPSSDPESGHLLFLREGSLMVQPFDARRLELTGEAVPIAEGVGSNFSNAWLSASSNGVLVYRTGAAGVGVSTNTQLVWFDRAGKNLGAAGEPGAYNVVSLSPDGTRAAVMRADSQGAAAANQDIWVHEFARGIPTRLTFHSALDGWPVWSPNGARVAFSSERDGSFSLYHKDSSAAGQEEVLLKGGDNPSFVQDWSRDGRFLLFSQLSARNMDLWALPLEGDKKPVPYLKTEHYESEGRFSPDGRFVAYNSNSSGAPEIYVRPFPASSGGQWQISKNGGAHPRWRRDGKELFYISSNSKMMAVQVSTAPTFRALAAKELFRAPILGGGGVTNVTRYDVTADGQRFLINATGVEAGPGPAPPQAPIVVVLNWHGLLRR